MKAARYPLRFGDTLTVELEFDEDGELRFRLTGIVGGSFWMRREQVADLHQRLGALLAGESNSPVVEIIEDDAE